MYSFLILTTGDLPEAYFLASFLRGRRAPDDPLPLDPDPRLGILPG